MKVKIVNLPNGEKRIISGELVEQFDLDYTQELSQLKSDIEFALSALQRKKSFWEKLFPFPNKDIMVYQGGHHLDIVDNDKGSLGWLTVEDHWHGFFETLSELDETDKQELNELFPLNQSKITNAEMSNA